MPSGSRHTEVSWLKSCLLETEDMSTCFDLKKVDLGTLPMKGTGLCYSADDAN